MERGLDTLRNCAVRVLGMTAWLACSAAAHPLLAQDAVQTGTALYQQGKYAEAEQALRGASGADAWAYRAASLARLGSLAQDAAQKQQDLSDAVNLAHQALATNATHPIAAAALGEALDGQGKHDDTIREMGAIIQAKADVAYVYYWRGRAYNATRQTARMLDDFKAFLRLAPDAPEAGAVRQLVQAVR